MARRSLGLNKRLSKLGPTYANCQPRPTRESCTRRDANPRAGCPNCEYQIQRRFYKSEVEKEFAVGSQGPDEDRLWPFDVMEQALGVVTRAYFEYPKRPDPKWPVALYYGVELYRAEVDKVKAADHHEYMEEVKSWRTNKGRDKRDGLPDDVE